MISLNIPYTKTGYMLKDKQDLVIFTWKSLNKTIICHYTECSHLLFAGKHKVLEQTKNLQNMQSWKQIWWQEDFFKLPKESMSC